MSSIFKRLARSGRILLEDDPAAARVLTLWLYAAVGPVFTAMLFLEARPDRQAPATAAVAALILLGAAVLLASRTPGNTAWTIAAGLVPIASFGIAYWGTGAGGEAAVAMIAAPVMWAAVMFDAPVVIATLAIAAVTHVVAVPTPNGLLDTIGDTAFFTMVIGIVALVGYAKSSALRRSRTEAAAGAARVTALLDAIPDTVARMTPDGRLLEVRVPAGQRTAEADVGQSIYQFLPAEVHERMRAACERAMATGDTQHVRYGMVIDDRVATVESRIRRSAPDELVVIRQDITSRLESDREHRYLAALVEQMSDAMVVVDREGIVRLWTPGAERVYGWTAAEVVGQSLGPFIVAEGTEETFAAFTAENFAAGRSRRILQRIRKDRSPIMVEASFTPLVDEDGVAAGLLTVTRDITATETAHGRELAQARLRGLEERMNEAELVTSLDGRIEHANDRALAAYGCSREELTSLAIHDLQDPSVEAPPAHGLVEATTGSTRFQTLHRRKDGSTFPVEVSARVFGVGDTHHVHTLVLDLTERRRMEADQQRMLDELLEAMSSVRTLSGLLPICMYCKNIRNDQGYWDRIEKYVSEHSDAQFSHGMCPDCYTRYVEPELQVNDGA